MLLPDVWSIINNTVIIVSDVEHIKKDSDEIYFIQLHRAAQQQSVSSIVSTFRHHMKPQESW